MKILASVILGFTALAAAAAELPPLNEPATTEYYRGKFICADLFTSEPSVAEKFYTSLLGWTATEITRRTSSGTRQYTVLSLDGRAIAGISLRPGHWMDEAHGKWVGYVSVPDVAKAVAAAYSGGGKVLSGAKDRPNRGVQAIFVDPDGATLGLMHSSSGDPGEFLPENGEWIWAELFARAPAKAGEFYHNVVGYDPVRDTRAGRSDDFVLVSGGYSRASMTAVSSRPKSRPAWLLFVRVADIRKTVARVAALGGRVVVPPSNAAADHWRAVITDPTGGRLGLVELDPAESEKEAP